jgi:hypothetical protein
MQKMRGVSIRKSLMVLACALGSTAAAQQTTRVRSGDSRPQPAGKVYPEIDFARTPTTVADLISHADLIVDATVATTLPSRRPNPKILDMILTDSLVSVYQVFAGRLPTGTDTIAVSQFGGKIEDLEMIYRPDVPMAVGERYIFFLDADTSSAPNTTKYPRYFAAGGWVGKARVEQGTVAFPPEAHGGGLTSFNGTDVISFIATLQQNIRIISASQKPMK